MPHSLDTGALRQNTQKTHLKYQCKKRKIYCIAQHLFLTEKRWFLKLFWLSWYLLWQRFWWGFPYEWGVRRRCWRRPSPRTRTSHRSSSPAAHSRLRTRNVSLKIAAGLWKDSKGTVSSPNLDAPALAFATPDVTWNFRRLVPKVAVSESTAGELAADISATEPLGEKEEKKPSGIQNRIPRLYRSLCPWRAFLTAPSLTFRLRILVFCWPGSGTWPIREYTVLSLTKGEVRGIRLARIRKVAYQEPGQVEYPLFSLFSKVRFLVFYWPGAGDNSKAGTWPGRVSAVLSLI